MSLTDNFIDSLQRQLTNAIQAKHKTDEINTQLLLKVNNLEQELKQLRAAHIKALEQSIEIGQDVQKYLSITNQLEKSKHGVQWNTKSKNGNTDRFRQI